MQFIILLVKPPNVNKNLTKFKEGVQEFFGVVGDDYIAY